MPNFAAALRLRLRGGRLRLHLDLQSARIDRPIELIVVVVVGFGVDVDVVVFGHRTLVESDVGMVAAEVPDHARGVAALGPDGEVADVARGTAELLQQHHIIKKLQIVRIEADKKKNTFEGAGGRGG